ncbi:MAG: DUF2281 domain-containing protein [Planctomycetaceae bacterium]|jgi:hypothetical protein|nr:DUF2281 domain-containing protein [Planctomycetaceae bacterium]
MQILLEVPDAQAASFMEVLSSFRDVVVKPVPNEIPKTAESHCTADDFDVPMEGYWDGREEERPPFVIGCLKGQIWMADDFDAPLEEFKEYME